LSSVVTSRSSSVLARAFLGEAANIERITAAIEVSPLVDEDEEADSGPDWSAVEGLLHESSCIVLVGGPIYNSVSRYILSGIGKASNDQDTRLNFVRRDETCRPSRGISLRGGSHDLGIDEWIGGGHEYYMVEKVTRKDAKVFICAGTSAAATAAAVQELIHWQELAESYPDQDFARVFALGRRRTPATYLTSIP